MTNSDKIRNMPNSELLELFEDIHKMGICWVCKYRERAIDRKCREYCDSCYFGIKDWLESECEGNGEDEIL